MVGLSTLQLAGLGTRLLGTLVAACSRPSGVTLQWTPKDDLAALKLHGRCDDVMRLLMAELGLEIPRYDR